MPNHFKSELASLYSVCASAGMAFNEEWRNSRHRNLGSVKVAVLIPAFNEEATIAKVVLKAQSHSDRVIVCDDGSDDMTGDIAARLGAEVIRHDRNLGYGSTLSSLFSRVRETDAELVVTLDADGQHNPDEIPSLIAPVAEGKADVAIGSRFLGGTGGVPGYRSAGIRVITNVSNWASKTKISDAQSGFRAYNRKAIESVAPADMGMGASTEILLKAGRAGLRIAEVSIFVTYGSKSSRNPLYHGLEVVLSSVKHLSILHPLVVYGVPGAALMLYGLYLGYNALLVYERVHIVVVGTTLIAFSSILIGLILGITALIIWVMITLIRDPQYRNSIWDQSLRAGPTP